MRTGQPCVKPVVADAAKCQPRRRMCRCWKGLNHGLSLVGKCVDEGRHS